MKIVIFAPLAAESFVNYHRLKLDAYLWRRKLNDLSLSPEQCHVYKNTYYVLTGHLSAKSSLWWGELSVSYDGFVLDWLVAAATVRAQIFARMKMQLFSLWGFLEHALLYKLFWRETVQKNGDWTGSRVPNI